jgi:hypothetical protein
MITENSTLSFIVFQINHGNPLIRTAGLRILASALNKCNANKSRIFVVDSDKNLILQDKPNETSDDGQ